MSPEQDKDRTNDQTDDQTEEKTVEDLKGAAGGSPWIAGREVSRRTNPVEEPRLETPPTEI